MPEPSISTKAEEIACAFHEAYERLAPQFGYRTRESSAKPWDEVPENNRRLMVATVREVLESGELVPAAELRVANERAAEYRREASLRETERDVYRQEAKNQQDRVYEVQDEFDRVHTERDELRADLAEAKIGWQCQTERGDRLKAKLESAATSCEWCSESTEEINNAYTQLDEVRAERDRLRKERDALMDDRLEAQRDALLRAIAEHQRTIDWETEGDITPWDRALYAKAREIRAGQ